MEESTSLRHQWIADHILPWEGEVRRWLSRYTRTLLAQDVDDLIQEAYARLWSAGGAALHTSAFEGYGFRVCMRTNRLQRESRRDV